MILSFTITWGVGVNNGHMDNVHAVHRYFKILNIELDSSTGIEGPLTHTLYIPGCTFHSFIVDGFTLYYIYLHRLTDTETNF